LFKFDKTGHIKMFQKGTSGNPKGRPPITINGIKPKELRERILDSSGDILNVMIQAALNGDTRAAMYLLDKVLPALPPEPTTESTDEPPVTEIRIVGVRANHKED
jgi:Family of unknown function (DUF5681)